jgi:hypothetical protein
VFDDHIRWSGYEKGAQPAEPSRNKDAALGFRNRRKVYTWQDLRKLSPSF